MEKELLPHCKSILGVDISQGMVDAYNKRATALGVSDKMQASAHELKGVEGELGGEKFDVIIVCIIPPSLNKSDQSPNPLSAQWRTTTSSPPSR